MMRQMTTDDDYDFSFTVDPNAASALTDTLELSATYGFVQFNQNDVSEGEQARITTWTDKSLTVIGYAQALVVSSATLFIALNA